jgi:hypothetical protein
VLVSGESPASPRTGRTSCKPFIDTRLQPRTLWPGAWSNDCLPWGRSDLRGLVAAGDKPNGPALERQMMKRIACLLMGVMAGASRIIIFGAEAS